MSAGEWVRSEAEARGVGSQGAGCSRGLRCCHTIQVSFPRGNPVTCSGEDPAPATEVPRPASSPRAAQAGPLLSESGSRRGGWQAGFPRRRMPLLGGRGFCPTGSSKVLLRPRTTQEVAHILR